MDQRSADAAIATRGLTIEYRPVGSLKPDPRNARTHPKRQIEQIARSVREFGFTIPVLIDEDGVRIAGHGRLRAAKDLGLAEVPTITLAGLTEVQKKALRLSAGLQSGQSVRIVGKGLLTNVDVQAAKPPSLSTGAPYVQHRPSAVALT